MRINITWGSHLPILNKVLNETTGSVLELGTGLYSTPIMHWVCFPHKRKLVSYESNPTYAKMLNAYKDTFHEIHNIDEKDWDNIDIEKEWDVAFIDHAPDVRRGIEAKRLANFAKYVVIHDSDTHNDPYYKYDEVYPLYKYRFDYRETVPNTTILSNFIDLTNFEL